MKNFLLITSLTLALFACKSKKEVVADTNQNASQTEEKAEVAADTHLQEPQESETDLWLQQVKKKTPDSLFARIQRTACFGRCPIYILSVYESGYVTYQGEKWVENEGMFEARIEEQKLKQILDLANEKGYFDFKNQYDSKYVTDLPSTITTVKGKNGHHFVANRYEGPQALIEFEKEFDALFSKVEWKAIPIE